MTKKYLTILGLALAVLSVPVLATENVDDNKVLIGRKGASATDKVIQFRDGGCFKDNATTGKVQFAHDCSTYNDIGSGSGQEGVNVLETANPGFDDDSAGTGWTASTGAHLTTTNTAGQV